jgi:hypothetical protein
VTRQELLRKLRNLWEGDQSLGVAIEIEDLMDDLACIGLEGASEIYLKHLTKQT